MTLPPSFTTRRYLIDLLTTLRQASVTSASAHWQGKGQVSDLIGIICPFRRQLSMEVAQPAWFWL